jgi:hypothetical protein
MMHRIHLHLVTQCCDQVSCVNPDFDIADWLAGTGPRIIISGYNHPTEPVMTGYTGIGQVSGSYGLFCNWLRLWLAQI